MILEISDHFFDHHHHQRGDQKSDHFFPRWLTILHSPIVHLVVKKKMKILDLLLKVVEALKVSWKDMLALFN
jgi:hypothetical protein